MIGIVIVTHGKLAEEFVHATEHVVGKQERMKAICIAPDDEMDRRRDDITQAVKACDSGDGVVVLTDMFGGTPSNLAISLMGRLPIEVVAGVNLPMLIKLTSLRTGLTLLDAAVQSQEAGRKYINVASNLLGQ